MGEDTTIRIRRSLNTARDPQERAECAERIEASVEPEREFVEVGLQVLLAHPVMDTPNPGLQVGKNQVDHGQVCLGLGVVAPGWDWELVVSELGESPVSLPAIGDHHGVGMNGVSDKATENFAAPIRDHGETNPPGVTSGPALV